MYRLNCQQKGRVLLPAPLIQHIDDPRPVGQLLRGQQYPITPFNSNPHRPQIARVGLIPGKGFGKGSGRFGMTGTPMRRAFSSGFSVMGMGHGNGTMPRSGRGNRALSSRMRQGHIGSPFCGPTQKHAPISRSSRWAASNHHPD